ncbi:MAG: S8 family serine peptidase [Spirulina sp.]
MPRQTALLHLHPHRRPEQLAYIQARTEVVYAMGDALWAAITEEQIDRFMAQGIGVQIQTTAALIELPSVVFNPAEGVPIPAANLRVSPPTGETTAYYLVQVGAPLGDEAITPIEALGGVYVQSLPEYALVFRLTVAQATAAAALPWVSWVGLYHPGYALSYDLVNREEPYPISALQHLARDVTQGLIEGPLMFTPFEDRVPDDLREAIAATGASLRQNSRYGLVGEATADHVLAIAHIPGIQAIEPYQDPALGNQRAGIIVGVNQVRSGGNVDFLINLDGQGEIVGVIDSGIDHHHPDLRQSNAATPTSRIIYRWNLNADPALDTLIPPVATGDTPPVPDFSNIPASGIIPIIKGPHGTHVTGTLVGNGTWAAADTDPTHSTQPQGMAPAAQVIFHAAQEDLYRISGKANFTNFLQGWLEAHQRGARVHNNSWGGIRFGSSGHHNAYTQAISAVIDSFAYCHPESLVVFAAGNDEGDYNGNGVLDMNRLSQEVVAKNILCVGASENVTRTDGSDRTYQQRAASAGKTPQERRRFDHGNFTALAGTPPIPLEFPISDNADQVALFSSRGRVRGSQRVRPDLVAPGTNVVSLRPQDGTLPMALGETGLAAVSADGDVYYAASGTSMAAPVVSGAAVLTRQFYRSRFGQLRRPVWLDAVSQFMAHQLAIAATPTSVAIVWVRPEGGHVHLVGATYSHTLQQRGDTVLARQSPIQILQPQGGDQPFPRLAVHGDRWLLLYRTPDHHLHLQRYNADLSRDTRFGSGGNVPLGAAVRPEPNRLASLAVQGDTAFVVWPEAGSETLQFGRFRATSGEPMGTVEAIGTVTETTIHNNLVFTGSHYATVWVQQTGDTYTLQARRINPRGQVLGAAATELVTQTDPLQAPHLAWQPTTQTYRVVWVTPQAAGDTLHTLALQADLTPIGTPQIVSLPPEPSTLGPLTRPPQRLRHPHLAPHPRSGYVLTWEDNSQLFWSHDSRPDPAGPHWQPRYDSYLAFLDDQGQPHREVARLRLSDTPADTQGFTSLTQAGGSVVVWLSDDEGNSDQKGIYAVNVTEQGAFQAQVDPYRPLLHSGRYQSHTLSQFAPPAAPAIPTVAMAWTGGTYALLWGSVNTQWQLILANGDGLPDGPLENFTRQSLAFENSLNSSLHWAGTHLVATHATALTVQTILMDGLGQRVDSFGTQGIHTIAAVPNPAVAPQIATVGSDHHLQVILVYGTVRDGENHLRYTVLNRQGNADVSLRDLARADGTAHHGWYHYIAAEGHSIAAWHGPQGGHTGVYLNRFRLNGQGQHRQPIALTDLPGTSRQAVIAPRPVLFGLGLQRRQEGHKIRWRPVAEASQKRRQREYGIAWEYRPLATAPTEIRFSRLNRDGSVGSVRDIVVVAGPQPATEPQLIWHNDGYGLAWLQPDTADGPRRLRFTVLDEDGRRVNLAPQGAGTPIPAPDAIVSGPGDVQRFHLVWNGRTVRLLWVEQVNGNLLHRQGAIALPGPGDPPTYDHPYQHPSAALLRATLINGATNLRCTNLPNLSNHPLDGYGWGRLNLRQALAPSPPVTFQVRDDNAIASGTTITYQFSLPPNTRLLRVTLAWTDPPGARLVNSLHLRLTTPTAGSIPAQTYVGNRWHPAPAGLDPNRPCQDAQGNSSSAQYSAPVPTPPPSNLFQDIHNVEQIVLPDPPPGVYRVEVIGGAFRPHAFQQFPGQPFALVFVGSGAEVRFGTPPMPANLPYF